MLTFVLVLAWFNSESGYVNAGKAAATVPGYSTLDECQAAATAARKAWERGMFAFCIPGPSR